MSKLISFLSSGLSRAALILAAGAALSLPATGAWAEKDHSRIALVLGNQSYKYVPALVNPVDDARAIAKKLRDLHFDVVEDYDVDENNLRGKVGEFEEKVQTAKVALVYYAGHGVTYKSENYILPVDFHIKPGQDPGLHSLTVSSILNQLGSDKRVTIVILDACRDNALELDGNRGMSRGLAPMEQNDSLGALVVYSTAPLKTAQDGAPGEHSPFAQALLDHIADPDVSVEDMMTRVRREVFASTSQKQMPWTSSALLGGEEVKLNPMPAAPAPAPVPVVTAPSPAAPAVPVATAPEPAPAAVPVATLPAPAVPVATLPAPAAAAPGSGSYATASVEPSATPDAPGKWRTEIGTLESEKTLNLTPAIVRKIQVHLQIIRLFHGSLNGNLDDGSTRKAILDWQNKEHVPATSRLGPEQLDALLAIAPTPPKPTELVHEVGTIDTQNGLSLSQDEIREIQQRLAASAYFKGTPSGKFDDATQQAIANFQKDEGLPTTGSLGPLQLQQLLARTEVRYEASLESDASAPAVTTRETTGGGHVSQGYNHTHTQHQYYRNNNGGGGANPVGQFFRGVGEGFGAVLGSRLH